MTQQLFIRIGLLVPLLLLAAFGAFGFLASFEGGVAQPVLWQTGYATLCAASLLTAGRIAIGRFRE